MSEFRNVLCSRLLVVWKMLISASLDCVLHCVIHRVIDSATSETKEFENEKRIFRETSETKEFVVAWPQQGQSRGAPHVGDHALHI
jgi:hypothetical protein